MAKERDRLQILKEIDQTERAIARERANENELIEIRNKKIRDHKKEILNLARELKKVNQKQEESYADSEKSISQISDAYSGLKESQKEGLTLTMDAFSAGSKQAGAALKIADINRQISELGRDDIQQRAHLLGLRDDEMAIATEGLHGNNKVVQSLKKQNSIAENYANLTDYQKSQMEKTHNVMKGMKSTIGGVLDVFSTLTSTVGGALGTALIGAGYAIEALGKTARELGTFFTESSISATVLGLVFEDAVQVAKGLANEMGGVENATFGAQLKTNLLATNLGIGGGEAAKLVGTFARLGDGTAAAGADMLSLVKSASIANGVIPAAVAGDLAANTEKFAEYGKDGGKNMIEAAIAAKKLGLEMSSLTNVTDGLLDIENSLTSELELGALLGKNINFEQARRLAYEGEIGSAVKSAIEQLGGVEEFNKMDIYQKREAAKALGISVEELGKMTSNMDKLNADGSIQQSQFDMMKESLSAIAKGPLGNMVKGLGSAAVAAGQMGFNVAGTAKQLKNKIFEKVGGMFGGAGPGKSPSKTKLPKSSPKGDPSALTKSVSKIKMNDVVKGAAALVLIAGAMFVLGKALQEFKGIGFDTLAVAGAALLGLTLSLAAVGLIMQVAGPAILVGALAMVVIAGAMFVLGKALQEIAKVPADFDFVSLGKQLLMFGLAVTPLGFLSPLLMLAAGALTIMGVGLTAFGIGLRMIPFETLNLVKDTLTNIVPMTAGILSLAAGITALAGSLGLLGIAGIAALPGLMALTMVGGITAGLGSLFGGGGEEGGSDGDGVVGEIKGLREDLANGKIAVYLDGAKVSSGIRNIVNGTKVNSYGL